MAPETPAALTALAAASRHAKTESGSAVAAVPADTAGQGPQRLAKARWEHATKDWYYEAFVHVNLLGQCEVVCVWGGRRRLTGGHLSEPVADLQAAEQLLERIAHYREKRGYISVAPWTLG